MGSETQPFQGVLYVYPAKADDTAAVDGLAARLIEQKEAIKARYRLLGLKAVGQAGELVVTITATERNAVFTFAQALVEAQRSNPQLELSNIQRQSGTGIPSGLSADIWSRVLTRMALSTKEFSATSLGHDVKVGTLAAHSVLYRAVERGWVDLYVLNAIVTKTLYRVTETGREQLGPELKAAGTVVAYGTLHPTVRRDVILAVFLSHPDTPLTAAVVRAALESEGLKPTGYTLRNDLGSLVQAGTIVIIQPATGRQRKSNTAKLYRLAG